MLTPILLVLLDGLGDRAHPELGGLTSNEAAATPHLDAFVAASVNGLLWPLGPGRAPSSEVAHWTFFTGSLHDFPGRAVLEARGHGVELAADAVVGYAALRAGAVADDGTVRLGSRPGTDDEDDARRLLAALPTGPFDGVRFRLSPVAPGEAILVLDGDVDDAVSDTDVFEPDLHSLLACEPSTADPTAARTAAAVNAWTIAGIEALRAHPVNDRRRGEGRPEFAFVTTKWWGRHRRGPSFEERTGLRGAIVSPAAYQGGMADLLGMAWRSPGRQPAGGPGLAERLRLSVDLLADGFDFVHCHDKSPDEAGHRKDPHGKAAVMASLDEAVPALDGLTDAVVVLTGDHATPASTRMLHSGDAVPLALRGPGVRPDPVHRLGERSQASGWLGAVRGEDLLPLALNAAERARFIGGRVGRHGGAAIGALRHPTALRVPGGSSRVDPQP